MNNRLGISHEGPICITTRTLDKLMDKKFATLTEHDWLQIEQAASGCISGTSDDWPDLVAAIEKITKKSLTHRTTASWIQGFCEGIMIQSGRNNDSL